MTATDDACTDCVLYLAGGRSNSVTLPPIPPGPCRGDLGKSYEPKLKPGHRRRYDGIPNHRTVPRSPHKKLGIHGHYRRGSSSRRRRRGLGILKIRRHRANLAATHGEGIHHVLRYERLA